MPKDTRVTYTQSTHTRVRVAFYTDAQNGLNIDSPVESHPDLGTVIGASTSKQLGSASGTFSITIKKPAGFRDRTALRELWLEPEDVWVLLQFVVDGQAFDVMLGLIDTVSEDMQRTGAGQRSETYTITGRDFGKVFETLELFVNFFHNPTAPLRSQGALTTTGLENLIGTPAHFIRYLLDTWIGNDGAAEQQFRLPAGLGGGFFNDLLQKRFDRMDRSTHGEAVAPNIFQIDQTGGKLWDVLQEYANGGLNELFVDLGLRPGQSPQDGTGLRPTIYLRERVFPTRSEDGRTTSRTKWNRLRTHRLSRSDVMSRQLAKGGASQRFNYWLLLCNGLGTEGFNIAEILQRGVDGVEYGQPGNIPIFNTESIQLHGVRRYAFSTKYIPMRELAGDGSPQSDLEVFRRLAGQFLKKVHDWYSTAPLELSGKITCSRVQPEIRIGQRVEEERSEGLVTYYCEGVDHAWTYPNNGVTTLTLTRGEFNGDDNLGVIYRQLTNPRVATEEDCAVVAGITLDDSDTETFLSQLASGCRVARAEGDDEGLVVSSPTRSLTGERDGTVPDESDLDASVADDPGMLPALDDSLPAEVGSEEEIPARRETAAEPGAPQLDQGQLERGEPIDLDFGEGDDPLGGLDLEGTET